ncbi:tRNA dimethylallyltransferase 9 [Phragmites australis]|uniref:tRNA dimethylallyltransferase 9 n=1 Tax=Phragmites australis TaxID=29695 RepID=UPI002D799710|nr:tRNA dimethylallyltransferase 9 [Phragmites australis]
MCWEMRPRFGTTPRAIWRSWPIICSQQQVPSSFHSVRKIAMTAASLPPPSSSKKSTVIVISGPTGAGKSRLAMEVAKRLGGEIISADSVQVYRGLDVGSAKPSAAEMNMVPHHLIDIMDASDDYSAGTFFRDARRATENVLGRGCVPVVAGGTGLYLRWYIYGKPNVPQSSMDITSAVWSELANLRVSGQWEEAVELVVKAGDPKARDLSVNNWARLSRSLEIIRSSGRPPSAFTLPYNTFCEQHYTELSDALTDGTCEARELDYEFLCIFLASPRVELYRSIDLRCEEMLADTGGLLSEASWLLDIGLHPSINSATRAIGYKQAMEYLLHCRQNGGESTPQEFLEFLTKFQRTSRNFAKRQITWFRNENIYQWVDASQPFEAVVQFICDAYHDYGARVVPESLEMKRESCMLKSRDLKTYRSENKVFLGDDDCSHVLDWIRRTQPK